VVRKKSGKKSDKKSDKKIEKKATIKGNYYACLKNNSHVKNTIKFKKNMILTGPNASGKTTVLKSVLINIITTQQFGCGFYQSAKLVPFKHIHCYLNIPDTSGRDSLFQAEARRCKDILDIIQSNQDDTHFCGFDELYSGTNPEEAESSGTAFMKYLSKRKNVYCILTTHFFKICRELYNNENIINCKMAVEKNSGDLIYKYKLEEGISEVKGGISVLKSLNYPEDIISSVQ
jgi:DNA mismatch repair ATPase MutS